MPLNLQARLLRILQERMVTPLGSTKSIPVNVSLICATHRNLREMVAGHAFREDLYYRLNGLTVKLPPLRARSDFQVVANKMLNAEPEGIRYTIADDVMALFGRYCWPGNFRQLGNVLQLARVMAGNETMIRAEHLPDDFLEDVAASSATPATNDNAPLADIGRTLEDVELKLIRKTLAEHGGNVSATARALGISRNTIYRRLR
jgi:transcriptional regulator of acetoin/glycerol metabolism